MFDSDTGMSMDSDSTDNLRSVMSDSDSSRKSFFNSSNESSTSKESFISKFLSIFGGNKVQYKSSPIILEDVLYIKYRFKDHDAVWGLMSSLSKTHSCKLHMTIFSEDSWGQPRDCAVRFRTHDQENLEKAVNAFKLDFNKIKTARLLSKEYAYESLNIVQTDNHLIGTIVVPAFSKVKKLPHVISDSLKLECTITEHKTSLFANKTIYFETKGTNPNLDCFKKLFEHYVVPQQNTKKRKIY